MLFVKIAVRRWLFVTVALGLVVLTGCMGGQSAGDAAKERIEQLSRSEYDKAWETLHPAQQAIVSQDKFVECGLASEQAQSPVVDDIRVDDERTERRTVPEVGDVEVHVVDLVIRKGDLAVSQEYELVEVDGDWRWVLNQSALDAFRAGECP